MLQTSDSDRTAVSQKAAIGHSSGKGSGNTKPLSVGDVLMLVVLIGATVWLHLGIPGTVPSGPDGGNWLAMAQDRFLGRDVMAATVTYPPLLPFTLSGFLRIWDPVSSITTVAILGKSLLVVAVYFCARPIGTLYGALAALLVGAAGAQLEAYSWGAYPQLSGTAFAITAVFLAVRYAIDGRRSRLFAATALAILAYLTHTLIGGLLVFVFPLAIAYGLWLTRSGRASWKRGAWVAIGLALPGAILAAYNLVINPQPGMQPVLNPLSLSWTESLIHTVSEAPVPWVVVAILGLSALSVRNRGPDESSTAASSGAWVVVGMLFFTVIGEPRALLLTQFGLILLALLTFKRLVNKAKAAHWKRRWLRTASTRGMAILGIAIASSVVVAGLDSYINATDWYRVVDTEEIEVLDQLEAVAQDDDLVLASQGHHGNPIGWWVQGFAGIRTYTGIDLRFLTFPEEREQAQKANDFFQQEMGTGEAMELLRTTGVDFLVVDRRGPDSAWLASPLARQFERLYESRNIVVLLPPRG